jgi:PAS domain S-box-containing protein
MKRMPGDDAAASSMSANAPVLRDPVADAGRDAVLPDSLRQLELIANAAPVNIAYCDSERRFRFVNAAYAERFGMKPVECIGRRIDDVIGAEAYASIEPHLQRALAGERVEFETEVPYATIGRRFLHCAYAPEISADGKVTGFVAAITDITDRRRAEHRLQADLRASRRLQELSIQIIESQDPGVIVGQILEAAMEIMGSDCVSLQLVDRTSGALVLVGHRGLTPEAAAFWTLVRSEHASTCAIALRTGKRVVVPDVEASRALTGTQDLAMYRQARIRASQSTVLVSRSGAPLGMISTHWHTVHEPSDRDLALVDILARLAADIFERKESEQALRESEELFRTLGEAVPDFLWMGDAAGTPIYHNPAFREYCGFETSEMAGDGWKRLHHPDHVGPIARMWDDAFVHGTGYQAETRLRHRDGTYHWFSTRTVPLRRDDGTVVRWVGTFTDIDARKQSEVSLQDENRRKDEFLATLAHELRNPLAPIRNAVALLRLVHDKPQHAKPALEMLDRQVVQMVRLIDDLLDVSRISRGALDLRKQPVTLSAVLDSAVETSRPVIERDRHRLEVALPEEPVWLDADAVRLAQAFGNLLNNACKYTADGGVIRIEATVVGDQVVVAFTDNGIGISAEKLESIFEMFEQVDKSRHKAHGGLGVGLTLVRKMVALHGGTVKAMSEGLGRGSRFEVRLPVADVSERLAALAARAFDERLSTLES